jgi:phage terminase small subunit
VAKKKKKKKAKKINTFDERRKRFAQEYLVDMNAKQAAIRSGYSKNGAEVQGHRLLTDANVAEHIFKLLEKRSESMEISARRVLEEIGILSYSDVRNYKHCPKNGVTNADHAPKEVTRAISSVETKMDDKGIIHTKYKLWSKPDALRMLAQHLALLVERKELSGPQGGALEYDVTLKDRE